MESTINERVKYICDKFFKNNASLMARGINANQGTIRDIIGTKQSKPNYDTLSLIVDSPTLNISSEWLLTGKGEMLKSKNETIKKSHTIKYYPSVNGSMGDVNFLDNPNEQSLDIILPNFTNCQYAINAYGDSMSPIIKSGQIVLLQEWNESFIEWGKIYLVITKNGYRTIKYIKHGSDNEHIKCVSANEENEPFEIDYKDVFKMFLVKGWICKDAI